jgi:serine/threonine protein kinase
MLSPDTVLQGRYRIVRQLGQGGMGAVYEAVDERLDTIVALKETLFTEEKLRKQFEREARLLARLHHQALPRVSDHFNESEGQFLVMQYIPGEDLAEMLSVRNGAFPQDEVIRWADQLCDALDYLHTQDPQIIHRDIKPQNLKLTARGQVVLLDFGLAKGSAGQLTAVTTSASIFGYTPNYAPLEQVQGMGTDARSDIYSLAATLFHLVTNVKPPDALSRAAAVVNGEPDPLPSANLISANVSAAFANVLGKGMSLKRDDRFAGATAMRDSLRVAADQPMADAATLFVSGATDSANTYTAASERATKLVGAQTKQGGLPSFASEAQTLVAGEATNVRESLVASVAPSRNSRQMWLVAAILLVVIVGGAAGFYAYRARRQSQQSVAQPAQQTESQSVEASQPANSSAPTNSQTEPAKTSEVKTQTTKTESAATRSSTARKSETKQEAETFQPPPQPKPEDPGHDPNRDPNRTREQPPPGQRPPVDRNRPPQDGRRPPRGLPEVRTLPNGGRVIKQPDGTYIFVGPKGQTKVVKPRERPRNGNSNQP